MTSEQLHIAVMNDEEQYSLWPAEAAPPAGWSRVGKPGSREEVLAFIATVWTDMRPRSLRIAEATESDGGVHWAATS
ncbi:MbtH family NRPS accessory protein [Bradyrhizobium sp. BR 10261]|uniref:MbtH family protein n=1 Tax=Bradyrhizobium sp. BR 10261 TaxID=2749992 RepID=UPI001C64545B|nr:MbtH family NRPS accessory protein [Bradyrhizobium sp. BR 10261]MBW7967164.1 MbtH family NRPS accessory protein [Bradyrhizobium sp. BR 10261]